MNVVAKLSLGLVAAAAALTAGTTDAHAQAKGKQSQVFELNAVEITARPSRPSAVVELGKIFPEIELAKIRLPFISKIEEAIASEPF